MSLLRKDLSGYSGASNLAFNEKIKKMKSEGADIIHFGFGQSPFPIPSQLVNRLQEFAHVNDYLSVAGDIELRKEICKFHSDWDNLSLEPEDVIVAPGSKSLIYLVMAVFGGKVWLAAPAWTTYYPQAKLAGHQPRIIVQKQENGWKLTPEDLRKGVEGIEGPHLLILTNPGNPSGCVYSRTELEDLVKVCREYDIIVLSDEIYGRLCFDGEFTSIMELYPEKTILTSGFSKWVGAGGWRLGYAHFPSSLSALKQAVLSGASHTHSCAPAPVQFAAAKALKEDKEHLRMYAYRARTILKWVANYCATELKSVGVTSQESGAGYYFMPDFECIREALNGRGMTTGQQMCDFFLQEIGVALMPSSSFLLGESDLTVRFCFVPFDGAMCLRLLEEDDQPLEQIDGKEFVEANCPDIVRGIQKLVGLVKSLQK